MRLVKLPLFLLAVLLVAAVALVLMPLAIIKELGKVVYNFLDVP
jgi:hypothetical protein